MDPFPPLRYVEEVVPPIFAKDGDDDIRCSLCNRRLRLLSFAGASHVGAPVSSGMGVKDGAEPSMISNMSSAGVI